MVTLIVIIPALVALILAVLPGPSEESAREWAGLTDATVRRRAIQSAYRPMVALAAAGVIAPAVLLAVVAMQIDPAAAGSSTSLSEQVRDGRWGDPTDGTFVFAPHDLALLPDDAAAEPNAAAIALRNAMIGAPVAADADVDADVDVDGQPIAIDGAASLQAHSRNAVADHVHAVEHALWLPSLGIGYTVGLDGAAIVHIALTLLLAFAAIAMTFGPGPLGRAGAPLKAQLMLTLALVSALSLAWCAMDLALLSGAWVLSAMLGVALVALPALARVRNGGDGEPASPDEQASTRASVAALALAWAIASVLVVTAIALIAAASQSTVDGGSFNLPALSGLAHADAAANPAFEAPMAALVTLLFAVGLVLPIFPLHHPILRAIAVSPTPTALLLSGAVCALAVLLVVRVVAPLMPTWTADAPDLATGFALLGAATVVVAAFGALSAAMSNRPDGTARALALIAVATFAMLPVTIALGTEAGLASALLHSVMHGVAVALLLVSGRAMLARRRVDAHDAYDAPIILPNGDDPSPEAATTGEPDKAEPTSNTDAGGVARRAPWTTAAFGLALLAIAGMPGLCLFVSNLAAAVAVLQVNANATLDSGVLVVCVVAVVLGVIAVALAALRLFLNATNGSTGTTDTSPTDGPGDAARLQLRDETVDLSLWEWIALAPLLLAAVALGFMPSLVTDWLDPIVNALALN